MVVSLKQMSVEEFVAKVLAGERDFSGIRLADGSDLSGYEGFEELQNYLRGRDLDLEGSPVIIAGSKFSRVKAIGLYLPFVRGPNADLKNADLREAYLWYADLKNADLREAYLKYADLRYANLENTDLWESGLKYADLRYANLEKADLRDADLEKADLRGVRNLEHAINLELAHFRETVVTLREREIIERALPERKLFIVKDY